MTRPVLFTRLLHAGVRAAAPLFGGRYGQLPPPPAEPLAFAENVGPVTLTGLRWAGMGRPLVLLHGLNNNAWSWARVASQLAPDRPVLAPTLRGHGRSTAPTTGYGLADTTGDLLRLLDAFGLEQVDLVGHSWGGKVALHLALTAPERVRALALADPVPPWGLNRLLSRFPYLIYATLAPERGPFASAADLRASARQLAYLCHDDAVDRRLWREGFVETPAGGFVHALPETGYREIVEHTFRHDLTSQLGTLRCPVLLLLPTFTVSFLPGERRAWRRALPQLTVRRIAGDHAFVHTNPLDTAEALRAFFGGVEAERGAALRN